MGDVDLKEARILRLEPTDTVVIEARDLTMQEAANIRHQVRTRCGTNRVLVLSGDVHLGVVRLVEL